MKKRFLILLIIPMLFATKAKAQDFYLEPKINVLAAGVAIFNPALEIGFGKFSAVQFEYIGAFAPYNYMGTGEPFLLNMAMVEYRAYFLNKNHKGLFAGLDFGLHQYKANKNIIPFINPDHGPGIYDWGFGIIFGLNVGYKFLFKDRFGLEISAAYGWQHSKHELYDAEGNLDSKMNGTAEWMPYKAGILFSYRFGQKAKNTTK